MFLHSSESEEFSQHSGAALCLKPGVIHTQLQVLPGKLPFLIIFKVLEVDVDVIIVIGSDHLDHLKLRLILGFLLQTEWVVVMSSHVCARVCLL